MFSFYKKYIIIAVLVHLSIALISGSAYCTLITLDGRDDAGINPTQSAFAEFINGGSSVLRLNSPDGQQWLNGTDVINYASFNNISWTRMQSAGNIWSSDTEVGETLSGLSAGTYRISPNSGAFSYDFEWPNDPFTERYWWKVYIKATQVYINGTLEQEHYYILGPEGVADLLDLSSLRASASDYDYYAANSYYSCNGNCDSPESAFSAVQNLSLDLPMAQGGGLNFWIWDWNSLDNSGAISLNVEPVPEPSTLVLLTMGILFLIRRLRT